MCMIKLGVYAFDKILILIPLYVQSLLTVGSHDSSCLNLRE